MTRILALMLALACGAAAGGCATLERAAELLGAGARALGPGARPGDDARAGGPGHAARTVGLRGLIAVHTWAWWKLRDASAYTRYEVIGWGVDRGARRSASTGPGPTPGSAIGRRGSSTRATESTR